MVARFAKFLVPAVASTALLITNPAPFNTEPLAVPFFLMTSLYSIFKTWTVFADKSLTVHEIRLKNDGTHVEISYLDFFGRIRDKNRFTMEISELSPPPKYSDSSELKGDLFPTVPDALDLEDLSAWTPWVKYYGVNRCRMYFSKSYRYLDKELLIAVLNGYYVDTSGRTH
mmetsp:Transcript_15831/g.28983  ORF Transcript_15831/g.28983 Transcript_15831/m.28983 type:complete len:171 (+) Transcript_15831:2921-3433(+)